MHRRDDPRSEWRSHDLAAILCDAERRTEERLRRGRTERDDQIGLHELQLEPEPVLARGHLGAIRFLVDAPLSLRRPLEVLHRVRHVHALPIDARFDQRFVEEVPGWPDERLADLVLLITGLLAHEHDVRGAWSLAEDRLRPRLPEIARTAPLRGVFDRAQRARIGRLWISHSGFSTILVAWLVAEITR